MEMLLQPQFFFIQFMSSLAIGMNFFIIAAGLTLIFGVLRVVNFAHGVFYMFGAYACWQVSTQLVQSLRSAVARRPCDFLSALAMLPGVGSRFCHLRPEGCCASPSSAGRLRTPNIRCRSSPRSAKSPTAGSPLKKRSASKPKKVKRSNSF